MVLFRQCSRFSNCGSGSCYIIFSFVIFVNDASTTTMVEIGRVVAIVGVCWKGERGA